MLLKLVDSLRLFLMVWNLVLCWKRDVVWRGFGFFFDVVVSVLCVWWSLGIFECLCLVFLWCFGGVLDICYCNCCGFFWYLIMNSVCFLVSLEFWILDLGVFFKVWLGFLMMYWLISELLNLDCFFNVNIMLCSFFVKMNLFKILCVRWFGFRCCSWKYCVFENCFFFVLSYEVFLFVIFFVSCWFIVCLKFWILFFGD